MTRIRAALADRDREISAGRWLALGTLLLFGAGFAAVAGIVAALTEQRLGLGPSARRVVVVVTFGAMCALVGAVGWSPPPAQGRVTVGWWLVYPARTFASALRLAAKRRLRPGATMIRDAAALLDEADDPSALARRIAAGGAPALRALALLESLDLLRARALRRLSTSNRPAPALATASEVRAAPSAPPALAREVHGLRERWAWPGAAGAVELHAAALAGWVLALDERNLARLGDGGLPVWSRPAGRNVSGVHVACDGARVAVLDERGVVTLLAGDTGERLGQLEASEAATSVAVSAGGARVWIGDRFGALKILDARGRVLREIQVGHPIDFLAMASEVEVGVVASRRGHVTSVDPGRDGVQRTFLRSDLQRVWVEEDGGRALLVVPADGVLAWDFGMGSMETYALDRAVRDAASDAPGDRIVALTFDDRLVVLDGAARVLWQCDAPPGSLRVRMSGDGERVWCADSTGAVRELEVLDRVDAGRPVLDLSAAAPLAAVAEPSEVEVSAEPEPGGFRRVRIDPAGGSLLLIHPDGRVAIRPASRNAWIVTEPGSSGGVTGDVVVADDGSTVGLALDQGVRRVRVADGRTRTVAIPAPRLATVPGGGDLLVATPHGELWLLSDERQERMAVDLDGMSHFVAVSSGDGWSVWWSRSDGAVSRLDHGGAGAVTVASGGELTPPVRLVSTRARVLVVDAAGQIRWSTGDGRETTRASLATPIVNIERVGDGFAALTDVFGNLHLAVADGGVTGTLGRQDGVLRAGLDPQGDPWLLRVHRQLLICQSWDGTIRARARVAGTPLDLASGPSGAWALLTTSGLFAHGLVQPRSSERARFLEL